MACAAKALVDGLRTRTGAVSTALNGPQRQWGAADSPARSGVNDHPVVQRRALARYESVGGEASVLLFGWQARVLRQQRALARGLTGLFEAAERLALSRQRPALPFDWGLRAVGPAGALVATVGQRLPVRDQVVFAVADQV